MSDLLFNINDLITPAVADKLAMTEGIFDKIEFLFQLIDFSHNYSSEEVAEISNYYLSQTGERYDPIYLSNDDKEFLCEYATVCPNFDRIKQIMNGLCCLDTYEECVAKAQDEINQIQQEQEQQRQEQETLSQPLTTHLVFNDDKQKVSNTSAENLSQPKTRSLDELLEIAKAKAMERNSR